MAGCSPLPQLRLLRVSLTLGSLTCWVVHDVGLSLPSGLNLPGFSIISGAIAPLPQVLHHLGVSMAWGGLGALLLH